MTKAEWQRREEYYEAELKKIKVSDAPNTAEIKRISSQIDTLFTEAIFDYARAKAADDKIKGLLERTLAKYKTGKNAEERKLSAIQSAENYPLGEDKSENLYELKDETNRRMVFMDSVLNALKFKYNLVNMTYGSLKIESQLS
jgi:hypothetical protein